MDFKAEYVLALRRHVPTYLAALVRSGDLARRLRDFQREAGELRQRLLEKRADPRFDEEQEADQIVRAVFLEPEDLKQESAEFFADRITS